MKTTRVLLTGAGGFVGGRLATRLASSGIEVVPLSVEDGDICSIDLLRHRPARVVHLAAQSFVPASWENPQEIYRVNTLGTLHALETCRKLRVPFVLGSCCVYGNPVRTPIDESHPVHPRNPYVLSKLAAEDLAHFYASHHLVPVTVVRPFNPYGPGQAGNHVIPHILSQLLDPACPTVEVINTRPRRDFVYVDDVAEAYATLIEKGETGVFNVGSGVSHSVEEVARIAMDVSGVQKPLVSRAREFSRENTDVVADCTAIHRATGWKARTPLREGLARVADAIRVEMET